MDLGDPAALDARGEGRLFVAQAHASRACCFLRVPLVAASPAVPRGTSPRLEVLRHSAVHRVLHCAASWTPAGSWGFDQERLSSSWARGGRTGPLTRFFVCADVC